MEYTKYWNMKIQIRLQFAGAVANCSEQLAQQYRNTAPQYKASSITIFMQFFYSNTRIDEKYYL